MSSPQPDRFGRYRLITELGSGGMSKVHLAVAESGPQIGRKLVVLKLLQEHLQADSDFTKLFVREARIAVEMSHSNVVHTHTVGEQDGRNYILMEYLEGVSLRSIMKLSAEWSLRDRLPLFGGICMALTGLHYVHEFHDHNGKHLNLVHRDIKPDNVFITSDGQVKLLDFGVARVESPDFERTLGTSVRGTVQYLAPESVQPDIKVDRRADIFSVGVILAELASGRRFWDSDPYTKILASLATGEVPSIEPRSGEEIPPPLARVCEQALKVNRAERFKTAIELRVALLKFLTKQGYRIDPNDLASIVAPLFEPIRREREALIQNSLSDLEVSTVGQLPSESSTFPGPATMPAIGDRTTPASFPSAPTSAPVEPEAKPRRAALWAVPLLLVPLVGLGAYQCTATDGGDDKSAKREASAPTEDRAGDPEVRSADAAVVSPDADDSPSTDDATQPPNPLSTTPAASADGATSPPDGSTPQTTAVPEDEPIVEGEDPDEDADDGAEQPDAPTASKPKRKRRKTRPPSPPPTPAASPPEPEPEPAPEPELVETPAKTPKPATTKPTGMEPNPYSR